jgi:hypothetical protein
MKQSTACSRDAAARVMINRSRAVKYPFEEQAQGNICKVSVDVTCQGSREHTPVGRESRKYAQPQKAAQS